MTSIMLFVTSITAIGALTVVNRKKLKNNTTKYIKTSYYWLVFIYERIM